MGKENKTITSLILSTSIYRQWVLIQVSQQYLSAYLYQPILLSLIGFNLQQTSRRIKSSSQQQQQAVVVDISYSSSPYTSAYNMSTKIHSSVKSNPQRVVTFLPAVSFRLNSNRSDPIGSIVLNTTVYSRRSGC